jgi:hypothetical protein
MHDFVLLCKSYRPDMLRAKRMAVSVQRFNTDDIPLNMCVPKEDLDSFKTAFEGIDCTFLTDEAIHGESAKYNGPLPDLYPRHLLQQLIKLEFWHLGLCRNYAWLDSDSYFIRQFQVSDFMCDDETPFTIQDEFTEASSRQRWAGVPGRELNKRIDDRLRLINKFRNLFGNDGPLWNFAGSTPIIWSAAVLQHLNEHYLPSIDQTIYELLFNYPCETHLYGEYLHHSRPIAIRPKPHMFKSYLYLDEFIKSQEAGENEYSLSKSHYGICMQSNWTSFKARKHWTDRLIKHFREYQVALGLMKFKKTRNN